MIEPKKIDIDKNKPLKPIGSVCKVENTIYEEYYFCPLCGAQVLPRCNCQNCGQVIDWNIEQGV